MAIFQQQMKQSIIWRGLHFVSLLLLNVLLSRFLKAEGIGVIFYLTNLFSLWILLGSLNMDGSFTYFSASKKIHHNQLAIVGTIWTLCIVAIIYLLLPIYFNYFDKDISNQYQHLAFNAICYLIGVFLINYFTALFYSLGNFKVPNTILVIGNFIMSVLIIFATNTNVISQNIIDYYFLMIALQGIIITFVFFVTYKATLSISLPTKKQIKELFHYSAIGLFGNFLFFFVYRIDYWFVKNWCYTSGDLGNYLQASKLAQMLLILPQIIASTIFPSVAQGNQNVLVIKNMGKIFRLFILLFFFIFIVIFLTGSYILPATFGSSFSPMLVPLLILLPGIFCLSISALLSAYFSGIKKNKYNVFAAAFALIVMVLLSVALREVYSIKKAAFISTVSYFTEALYCIYIFVKLEKLNPISFLKFTKTDFTFK